MANHKCGTCFFFQEGSLPGSGWCRHPERARSDDVKVLVHRNRSPACRNGWGQDLWTDARSAQAEGMIQPPVVARAERPATETEIISVVNRRDTQPEIRQAERPQPVDDAPETDQPTAGGEDVVVGQITVMPSNRPGGRRRLIDQVPMGIRAIDGQDSGSPAEPPVDMPAPRPADPALPDSNPASRPQRDRLRQRSIQQPAPVPTESRWDTEPGAGASDLRAAVSPATETAVPARHEPTPAPRRAPAESPAPEALPAVDVLRRAGLAPAPIPEPVPARELRTRDRGRTGPFGTTQAAALAESRPGVSDDAPSSRTAPSLRDALRGDDHRAARPRRALPDLDEALGGATRARIAEEHGDSRAAASAPSRPDRVASGRDRDLAEDLAPREPSGYERREANRPVAPPPRPVRSRPSIPTRASQEPEVVRTVPTVDEVNRGISAGSRRDERGQAPGVPPRRDARDAHPGRPVPPPPRGRSGSVQTARAVGPDYDHDRDHAGYMDDRAEPRHQDRYLEPPVQLRPETVDYGEYETWMDLSSAQPVLSPSLPRKCSTCRDFRASEQGDRGWCTNRDAFTHRRMVDGDDLPCGHSFGWWWTPYDDVWLKEASLREHRNPTPLLDQLMPDLSLTLSEKRRRRS